MAGSNICAAANAHPRNQCKSHFSGSIASPFVEKIEAILAPFEVRLSQFHDAQHDVGNHQSLSIFRTCARQSSGR